MNFYQSANISDCRWNQQRQQSERYTKLVSSLEFTELELESLNLSLSLRIKGNGNKSTLTLCVSIGPLREARRRLPAEPFQSASLHYCVSVCDCHYQQPAGCEIVVEAAISQCSSRHRNQQASRRRRRCRRLELALLNRRRFEVELALSGAARERACFNLLQVSI